MGEGEGGCGRWGGGNPALHEAVPASGTYDWLRLAMLAGSASL